METIQILKVVIFEDEILLANDLKMQLEPYHFNVIAMFRRAEEGLKFLDGITSPDDFPDIVMMDISLAGAINGIEAAGIIMSKYHCALVYITGMSQLGVFDNAFNAKPHAYLIKPFDINQAIISIRLAIYQNNLEKQLLKHQRELEELLREKNSQLKEAKDKMKANGIH